MNTAHGAIVALRSLAAFAAILTWAAGVSGNDSDAAAAGGVLTVRFTGVQKKGGEVLFSLADSEAMFKSDREAFRSARVPADSDTAVAVFADLPAGSYAVKVFHDANSNEKLDIGLMGPKEKYGFSNNVFGFMGPPAFEDAKFTFDGGESTIEIEAR